MILLTLFDHIGKYIHINNSFIYLYIWLTSFSKVNILIHLLLVYN